MIHQERIKPLGGGTSSKGDYVLYWMQASQREADNHALEYAVEQANARGLPVLAYFGLTPDYPEANLRHYAFMLEGLAETKRALEERGISLVVRAESPDTGAAALSRRAALLVADRGYVRLERQWRTRVAARSACPVHEVETNAVVPVEAASSKEEYSAATLRPKIRRLLRTYFAPLRRRPLGKKRLKWDFESLDLSDPSRTLSRLRIDRSVGPTTAYRGGASAARRWLDRFVSSDLKRYHESRSDPGHDLGSRLSPYLHFGQISPAAVLRAAARAGGRGMEKFLEELIVRRELSLNFVFYNERYDSYSGLPDWCRRTLEAHRRDRREAAYSPAELEAARTHDPYWNAAQREMTCLGRMHNTLRMYWGKRLLQWTARPEDAFRLALRLNNKYELDGRDPNSFASVAWCFGKHDRPWPERPVFGMVRSMTASGLERKYDMLGYTRRVEQACAAARLSTAAARRLGGEP